jgi:hypothetical protein
MVAQTFATQKVCGFSEEQPPEFEEPNACATRLNPWDLPPAQINPSNEKIALLN